MKAENWGLKILGQHLPVVQKEETDLIGAAFAVNGFRDSFSKMSVEERNKMRESRFYRDPHRDAWVYVPEEIEFVKVEIPSEESGVLT